MWFVARQGWSVPRWVGPLPSIELANTSATPSLEFCPAMEVTR